MLLRKMFSRKWWLTTLLVFLGTALCIRLGIWQLNRLEGRRAFNAQVESMRAIPALNLNSENLESLESMEWRAVTVTGEYDFENQIAIRNQYYGDQYGYHLLTPLQFSASSSVSTGSTQRLSAKGIVVLVDRGWVPADGNSAPADWRKYDEVGEIKVTGQIRRGQGKPSFGGVADAPPADGSPLWVWNNADIESIARQMPYPILGIYIQPDMTEGDTEPPIPFQPEIEITEGPHFGYALQWFTFAALLFFGYPFYLRKQATA